jgi:F-type H+-transporting ATPase subunit delta
MNQSKKIDKSAKAIFQVFKENSIEQLGSNVLDVLTKVSSSSQKFKQFLSTKRIDLNTKKDILSNIFSDSLNQDQLSLAYCLLDNIDFNYLESINKKYQKLLQESKGNINVQAITAFTLSENELSELESNIKSKTNSDISLVNITDKRILGGMKLKVGNTLIDGSLSTKLEKLKQSMVNK